VPGSSAASASLPHGYLDSVTAAGTAVTVGGWVFDPDAPHATVSVRVSVDGRQVAETAAGASRPDVGRAYPAAGAAHGFLWWGTVPAGTHQVCVDAVNQGPGSTTRLGCRSVTVPGPTAASASLPRGHLDSVTASGTAVTATGWTFDPDAPRVTVPVLVYVDGAEVGRTDAGTSRPDVGRKYPAAGSAHGYEWTGTASRGTHEVCTVAVNQGPGSSNPRLGCRTVTVP
jgi:hypothetical protein